MNYDELSDFEINKLVAMALGHGNLFDNNGKLVINSSGMGALEVDYCNKFDDAEPMIVSYRISLINQDDEWHAFSNIKFDQGWCISGFDYEAAHKNRLRAAMVVFLKIKDAEQ